MPIHAFLLDAWNWMEDHFRGLPQPWWAALLAYELLIVGQWFLEHLMLRRQRARLRSAGEREGHDRRYVRVLLFLFVMLQMPLLRAGRWWSPFPVDATMPLIGLALALSGGTIRILAIRNLGEHFSYAFVVGKEHRLVTTGLYSTIRHPLYSGLLLYCAGLPLLLREFWSLFVFVGWSIVSVIRRVRREERALKARFGAEYEAWRARTKLLIPGIL
ncbi:MAG: methyltransferase family protein [Planctomycetaceae bacterium]